MMYDIDALKPALLKGEFTSIYLTCDDHKTNYETVAQAIKAQPERFDKGFVSPEEKQRCIDTNTMWSLQWYPNTPVGFYVVHASSFAAIMDYLKATGDIP